MFDDYYCFRCGKGFKWDEMTATPAGNLFCPECKPAMDPANEPIRKCPIDNTDMKKQLAGDVFIVDRCPSCGGVWLDKGELEIIQEWAQREGYGKGTFLGQMLHGFPIIFRKR